MKNKTLWILFTIFYHCLSWVSILIYTIIRYGDFVMKNSVILIFAIAVIISIFLLMRSLKETAEHGYGMARKIARSVRAIIPLILGFIITLILNKNIGNIYDLMLFTLGANIVAQPINVLAYYYGPAYIEDTSGNAILKKLE